MKIRVQNNTASPIFVGSTLIPPGEARECDENEVADALRPAAPQSVSVVTVDVAALLSESEADIIAALPMISTEQIHEIAQIAAARAEGARTPLVDALEQALQARGDGGKGAALREAEQQLAELSARPAKEVIAALAGVSDEELGGLEKLERAKESPRKTVLEAIGEETLKRAGGGSE